MPPLHLSPSPGLGRGAGQKNEMLCKTFLVGYILPEDAGTKERDQLNFHSLGVLSHHLKCEMKSPHLVDSS